MDTSSSISALITSSTTTVSSSSGPGVTTTTTNTANNNSNSIGNSEDGGSGGRGRNYTSYDIKFKLEAVKYSETHSGVATATQFGVDPKRIRDWRRQKDKLDIPQVSGHFNLPASHNSNPLKMSEPLSPLPPASPRSTKSSSESEESDDMSMSMSESPPHTPNVDLSKELVEMHHGIEMHHPEIKGELGEEVQPLSMTMSYNSQIGKKKPQRHRQMTLQTKLEALKFLETHSVNATSREFQVDPKSIRQWRANKAQIEQTVQEELLALEQCKYDDGTSTSPRKRIPGAGRKKQEKVIVEILENPNKRHRRSIKLSDKVEIIRLIENGQTQSDVARSLGISQSTVQTIWSNKPEILDRNCNPKRKRKNLHWKKYSTIDHSLFVWYRQCRETGVPVDGRMLLDKATEFAEYFKQPEFKPQALRWVDMFKKRHSISEVDRQDRIQAAAVAAVEQHHHHNQHHHQHNSLQHHNNSGMIHPTSSTSAHVHDLVPEFDLSSFPGIMAGLYPQDPTNPSGAPPSSGPPLPVPNFNPHIPIVVTMPVTTCDAMKYVELIRSWLTTTFGENEEIMSNHLNAIENAILKRRMTEMLAPDRKMY